MSLGTGLAKRPYLVVNGVTFDSGDFANATGCLSASVALGIGETGFAGTSRSGAVDI